MNLDEQIKFMRRSEAWVTPPERQAIIDSLRELKRLREVSAQHVAVCDAHELDSLSCDRDGNVHCECEREAREAVRIALKESSDD